MENKHVTHAFQKALSDLPPVDQTLRILSFTAEMETQEAAEAGEFVGGDIQEGREAPSGLEGRELPGPQEAGKDGWTARKLLLPAFLAVTILAVIEAVWMASLLLTRGYKTAEPDGLDPTFPRPDSEYVGTAETGVASNGDFELSKD